jgi:hypothetical protein
VEYEEFPETTILEEFLSCSSTNRFWLILGEPGSGKTTLLKTWFSCLAARITKVSLGAAIPILVSLRSVPREIWKLNGESNLADALWNCSIGQRALLEDSASTIYQAKHCNAFDPIWLLDGVDELDPKVGREEAIFQKLANLPGRKMLSGRTAVYESLRQTADAYKIGMGEYEILGLRPTEQREFLRQMLPEREQKPDELFATIQENAQVRLLATNPLMLSLMAEVAAQRGERIALPSSRAEFYQQAIDEMWHRKLKSDVNALRLRKERDQYLTEKAAVLGLTALRTEISSKVDRDLERGLIVSGLVRVDDRTRTFEFIHLTFQEYYLALSLKNKILKTNLEKYWSDPRYQETLALLISLLVCENRHQEIEQGIRWLIEWGESTHDENPEVLRRLAASPLRVACHLVTRAAISPGYMLESTLLEFGIHKGNHLCKIALAHDSLTPSPLLIELGRNHHKDVRRKMAWKANIPTNVLSQLASDRDRRVREGVAWNTNTPTNVLSHLASDHDKNVRRRVVDNENTPANVLFQLASDQDQGVRWNVAWRETTLANVLSQLASDQDNFVRGQVARNGNTPVNVLRQLASDHDKGVRQEVARNRNAPVNVQCQLASDHDEEVRTAVAGSGNTPVNVLCQLASDHDKGVRRELARNGNTPVNVLCQLASDHDKDVRQAVAMTANVPADVLCQLASDCDKDVRQEVADNENTPVNVLCQLVSDHDKDVRRELALNKNTPASALCQLASDRDNSVRMVVARHENTPVNVLCQLASDHDKIVRREVADNENTPVNILCQLASDRDKETRRRVANNENTPINVLCQLASDHEKGVRQEVARNGNTPVNVLCQLASDHDKGVRQEVAENANILLEDLRMVGGAESRQNKTRGHGVRAGKR